MIEITEIRTYGWEEAIRGMRNSYNSWDKCDSEFDINCRICDRTDVTCEDCVVNAGLTDCIIGPSDLTLMKKLCAAGTDHCKFRRMITVSMDINASLYWWKEYDTYKVGTVANSCSTMHKIAEKEFTLDDFSCEHLFDESSLAPYRERVDVECCEPLAALDVNGNWCYYTPKTFLKMTCNLLNHFRELYLKTKDKKYWWQIIQLLPSSYNQKRTVMLNYEVLANIYKSRKNHKLDEWQTFCNVMESTLPYPELFTTRK